MQRKGEVLATR